jgi:hypothetical protein
VSSSGVFLPVVTKGHLGDVNILQSMCLIWLCMIVFTWRKVVVTLAWQQLLPFFSRQSLLVHSLVNHSELVSTAIPYPL